MKIIRADNYDRELFNEVLVAENITSESEARIMVAALNSKTSSDWFYQIKPDDYVLRIYSPYD